MKILFICTANVCRSPLAEGYLKSLLQQSRPDLEIGSAGIAALVQQPPLHCALEVAKIHGFDISNHRARSLTAKLAKETDKILCMETWQANSILELDPALISKVALLGSFYPQKGSLFQIPDPRQFSVSETAPVFELIKSSVENYSRTL